MNFKTLRNRASLPAIAFVATAVAGSSQTASADQAVERIQSIEQAHAVDTYQEQSTIKADLVIDFGPMHVEGTAWFTPSLGKIRLELVDGQVIVYDGKTAWLSPADAEIPGPPARFHVVTWPYFIAVPYKLDDAGTRHAA
ncbi:LolA family protein [Algisphaera agarilytica]|uniref:Outer membrane lipoprotein-sorting protein n=1 Tax=Algisphaera agarilytica TaxID=1385975 RepID=A0A7X0H617_9BACT|nr:hypothetical protein [Algisphaera agarilytica]MBB6429920.1 outer membrane lipoprotein-sorting protein [Algisphaera agarilytica]